DASGIRKRHKSPHNVSTPLRFEVLMVATEQIQEIRHLALGHKI
ncbi:unnamed protein product, partial [marine sediment metagenome]